MSQRIRANPAASLWLLIAIFKCIAHNTLANSRCRLADGVYMADISFRVCFLIMIPSMAELARSMQFFRTVLTHKTPDVVSYTVFDQLYTCPLDWTNRMGLPVFTYIKFIKSPLITRLCGSPVGLTPGDRMDRFV